MQKLYYFISKVQAIECETILRIHEMVPGERIWTTDTRNFNPEALIVDLWVWRTQINNL